MVVQVVYVYQATVVQDAKINHPVLRIRAKMAEIALQQDLAIDVSALQE